ncbi:UbiA family prenyltransferase [Natronomonas pharaonis DSM 2160]|uniref:UbiA family prenyltransferase n=1 Tax=Natronomonas pharaonis (strain ATCC 35678 / DSM 2160 / CIP 103997 / JCM 8858 / NBRC 14720 / NCIMB 2260 / Gabara) TaxID=348780 RepID=A0A1U7ETI9_NATPD|nr:UbiA family prenyltransferase [Natronomonas pharaonis]CAI48222.1 UbiA family prenyltransferase [Natronomonas pharaonis DSM 2160]
MERGTAGTRQLRRRLRDVAVLFVHSNLLISLAATSVAFSTMWLVGVSADPVPLFIVFAATLFVYSLNRLTDIEEDRQNVPRRAAFIERYGKPLFAAGVALYLGAIAVAVWLGLPGAPFLILPAVVAALYSTFKIKQRLLVKNLVVGVAWGIIPLGVGVYYGVLWTPEVLFAFVFVTVMLTVAAAIFDIKDIEGDRAEGIRTFPIVFSPAATRWGAAVITVLVAAGVVVAVATGVVSHRALVFLSLSAYVFAYIPFASRDRGPLFYGFVVDGEHVFLGAVVLLVEWL